MKIWAIIPAYNEQFNLKQVLEDLKQKGVSILVIDDGSTDNTYEIARQQADLAIRNSKNLGKGVSLKKGIAYLLKNDNFDYIITMDADGQHPISDLGKFLEQAQEGESFVVGNRMQNLSGMPKIRVITNKLMSWIISKIIGQKIPDTQCGFRLIKREVLKKIRIETEKYEVESEIVIKAARLGFKIKSVPIESVYLKNQHSRIRPIADTFRFIKFIFRLDNEK